MVTIKPSRSDSNGFIITHQVSLLVLDQLAVEGNKCACFSNWAGIYSASWQLIKRLCYDEMHNYPPTDAFRTVSCILPPSICGCIEWSGLESIGI